MAQSRSILTAGFDRIVSWLLGLPSERCSYSTETVTIPLKDGTTLKADIYRPTGIEPLGTILVQCPYGRGIFMSSSNGHTFAPRGYQVLLVSSRGTFGSTGEFDGNNSQREDGQEVVAWMRGQSWYTGSFATLGASNMGYAQWALLRDQLEDMVAAIISVGPHDLAKSSWGSGSFTLLQRLSWSELILKQETAGFMERMKMMKNETLAPLMNTVPLQDQIDAFFGDKAPWLNQALNHPDIEDPSWSRLRHTEALEKADIPILLISAWHDIFLDQTMEQYQRLHERGCNVALTICAGGHMEIMNRETTGDTFAWLEKYLAGKQDIDRKSPVKVFVGGSSQRWVEFASWPPPTVPSEFYLGPDGDLGSSIPSEETSSFFTFDPEAPTPTLGGPLMSSGGSVEDSALAARDDTLVFTTEPLEEPLTVFGQPMVKLEHSTDRSYADLFVRISEVSTKGKSYNITEGFVRLPESRTSRSVTIMIRPTAYQFPAGARIRFLIAGGSHPQYARNYGSGEPLATGTTLCPVKHSVYHGGQAISSLVLPIKADSVGETAEPI
ncbi:hypothetical protein IL306_002540 [Fusarium sp. DS 682]|nr:hypothetical protein IL306_002540 [Fusarium sp. DS 682]